MGRKKLPDDEVRAKPLRIRMTPEERAQVDQAAQSTDATSSEWAREVLLNAASQIISSMAKPRTRR
jgi:uncharacterized protein (DUF1778 family)